VHLADSNGVAIPFVPSAGLKAGAKSVNALDLFNAGKKLTHSQSAYVAISKGEKLTDAMSNALRADARKIMTNSSPAYKAAKNVEVHHIIPLEWAHKMGPAWDPNNLTNLVGVDKKIHTEINKRWAEFKKITPIPLLSKLRSRSRILTSNMAHILFGEEA